MDAAPTAGASFDPDLDRDLFRDEDSAPIGPDDWYNVGPDGETNSAAEDKVDSGTPLPAASAIANDADADASSIRNRVYTGLTLIALLGTALGWLFWRRRRQEKLQEQTDTPSLAFGVHKVIKQTAASDGEAEPATAPVAPKPAPAVIKGKQPATFSDPARLDLALEIISASRSVMMFTVEFQLDIANRSDGAVRDLNIAARLACAQRGAVNAAPIAAGQPIAEIHRIGPYQSRRVTAQLRLPLTEVQSIRQGSRPLFIPLLHITLEGAGQPVTSRSYVIGTPSATSQSRVHPLPLDGPPGGLPGLRAHSIKTDVSEGTPT